MNVHKVQYFRTNSQGQEYNILAYWPKCVFLWGYVAHRKLYQCPTADISIYKIQDKDIALSVFKGLNCEDYHWVYVTQPFDLFAGSQHTGNKIISR